MSAAPRRIAVVGAGISGLVAAHELHRRHHVTVYEAAGHAGGHTHTVDVHLAGVRYAVDTGFIVFNHRTYPNFVRLLETLGVASQPSSMSFSVKCERTGLEYNGGSPSRLFAQRSNLLRPRFYRMLGEILRFFREAPALLDGDDDDLTLGQYLDGAGYSRRFTEQFLVPMGAAIWSADPRAMYAFPARYFVRFFHNHGMLSLRDRPVWRVVRGGSREYVERLVAPFRERIRLRTPVTSVRRMPEHVQLTGAGGALDTYDHVFLACHSDQALALLADPSPAEREVLGAIPYQRNDAVLHTDHRLLPARRRAWAAWNVQVPREACSRVRVTYNMNILQGLDAPRQLLVTLNHDEGIDPERVIERMTYHHPLYTPAGVRAQRRVAALNGARRTSFCGAWCGYGFHEDGVNSALAACEAFQRQFEHEELHLRRVG